ncbi:MAG: methyltransferase domain-containing protein [Magnetococcales bacterium]|nr:methyltransferase domain-containing protein [Magnetococcales bacterium]
MRKVLNVGGNSKAIAIPDCYDGWEHILLDIDPRGNPDVVCDARELGNLPAASYDSIYCSHNLEHYYHHDVARVLSGFIHLLKDDGFALIRVPDMGWLMRTVAQDNLDIEDILYHSPAGPIAVRDMIYGLGTQIERSGVDFFAHKTGFTQKSLHMALQKAGFSHIFVAMGNREIFSFSFKNKPSDYAAKLLGLPDH